MPDDFAAQPHTRARGRAAEAAAEEWLQGAGYRIVERNYVTRAGEIDLIARDGDYLCFLEVKARTSTEFGPAVAAVTLEKQVRIARAAALYLADSGYEGACRFDVLGMEAAAEGWSYELIRGAFEAPGGW